MKIKNNTKNLIPRHLTGGLVRKYQLAAGSRGIERYKPTFTDRIVLMSRNTPQNRAVNRAIFAANDNTGLRISTWPKYTSITNKMMTTWPDGETTMSINDNKDSIGLDGTIYNNSGKVIGNDGIITTASKPAQNKGTQGKPAGTKGNGSKGGTRGSKGNVRTTAKPAATTFTESPTNITDQGLLDARNAAMRRGWRTYNYKGLTYQFTGDEYKLAANNWRNRRKAGYQAEGLLNLNSTVETPDNVPNGMEYASDYLNASTPGSTLSAYNTLALNVLSDVDKRIAEIRPTISSRSAYADMEDAMAGWDLKRKLKMMDASVGTAWDWNTEEGRKNFVGMANLMKNGKGNYNKVYDQWIASQPKITESQNETYAQRFPLAYQSGLLTTPITDNSSLTTQLPTSTNQPSVGWVNTLAILDAINRAKPQLSVGNTNNNDFVTLELPQNLSGFVSDLFKRKRTGNWTFAKQGTKLIRRK